GCHGKADGQNGFHLSLFGYDPAGDYEAITRGSGARRVSTADPELSLLVMKATGMVPHGGGRRIAPGSEEEATLIAWIEAGAPRYGAKQADPVVRVTVEPPGALLAAPGDQQFRVVAHHRSGRVS